MTIMLAGWLRLLLLEGAMLKTVLSEPGFELVLDHARLR